MRLRVMRPRPAPDRVFLPSVPPSGFPASALQVDRSTTPAGHTVLALVGELESATVPILRQAIAELAQGEHVIVDMSGVPFLDSCGIGCLIGAVRRVRDMGGDMSLAAVCRPVERVLNLAGVDRIVKLADTVPEAAATFQPTDTHSPTDGDPIAI